MTEERPKRVLYINLSSQKCEVKVHSNYAACLGGVGLAATLYNEHLDKDPIVLAISPFTGLLPFAATTCVAYKSPLTGTWAENYVGGWLGAVMHFAALDAIVVRGVSKRPVFLSITDDDVSFIEASELIRKGSFETSSYLREHVGLPGKRSILAIGPAGEMEVSFASVLVDTVFELRRFGLGAKFGRMGMKGVVISGTKSIGGFDDRLYDQTFDELVKTSTISESNKLYPGYTSFASLAGLSHQNTIGGLPTRNLSASRFEAPLFSEDDFLSKFSPQSVASFSSPIPEHYLFETQGLKVPLDYESAVSLGSLLGLGDLEDILSLRKLTLDYGLDPVSTGVALSFLTEYMDLNFGEIGSYRELLVGLVDRREEWADHLSEGVKAYSNSVGSINYALQLSGVEMAPYFNGYGTLLSQLIGLSHSLYSSEGHIVDMGLIGKDFEDGALVDTLVKKEKTALLLNSLSIMYYARGIYADPTVLFSALKSFGYSWSGEDVEKFSEGLYRLILSIKTALNEETMEGDLYLPERFFTTPSAYGILRKDRLRSMVSLYHDKQNSNR